MEVPLFLEETLHGQSREISYKLPVFDELGRQVSEASKTLNVKIPAGVGDGERIRLKGQGVAGVGGGQNGDLYLVIRLAPHPLFEIDGHNLSIVAPLAPWEAALGASIEVPTLTGKIALTVPAGSQSGKRLRVKGQGAGGQERARRSVCHSQGGDAAEAERRPAPCGENWLNRRRSTRARNGSKAHDEKRDHIHRGGTVSEGGDFRG